MRAICRSDDNLERLEHFGCSINFPKNEKVRFCRTCAWRLPYCVRPGPRVLPVGLSDVGRSSSWAEATMRRPLVVPDEPRRWRPKTQGGHLPRSWWLVAMLHGLQQIARKQEIRERTLRDELEKLKQARLQ